MAQHGLLLGAATEQAKDRGYGCGVRGLAGIDDDRTITVDAKDRRDGTCGEQLYWQPDDFGDVSPR